jgi:hypothetical protein
MTKTERQAMQKEIDWRVRRAFAGVFVIRRRMRAGDTGG